MLNILTVFLIYEIERSCCMTHVKWDFSYMYASVSVPQRQNERQTKANSSTKVHLVKPMSELRLLLK